MWMDYPNELLSTNLLPLQNDSVSEICNKLTRMLIIIVIIMACYSYSYITILIILLIGIISIFLFYMITIKKENFSNLTSKMDNIVSNNNMISGKNTEIPNIHNTYIYNVHTNQPQHTPISELQSFVSEIQKNSPETVRTKNVTSIVQEDTRGYTPITNLNDRVPHTSVQLLHSMDSTNHNRKEPESKERNETIKQKREYYTPDVGTNNNMYQEPVVIAPRIMDSIFASVSTNSIVDENPVQNNGGMSMPTYKKRLSMLQREQTKSDISEAELKRNRVFLRDIQPHSYSFTNERPSINSNIGISSTPQIPELQRKMYRGEDGRNYPFYSRIDPQLIRDDIPEERKRELPSRNEWSEELPQPTQGNPMYNIYDPRFTGYGDASRSYFDTNMGQVKYYYSDIDAYRRPNFVIRNKIDHVDFIDPMGKVDSTYNRTTPLEDINERVNDDWLSKSTEFREDIMEKLMRKNNSESWQLRKAPHSKGARLSTFTSSY